MANNPYNRRATNSGHRGPPPGMFNSSATGPPSRHSTRPSTSTRDPQPSAHNIPFGGQLPSRGASGRRSGAHPEPAGEYEEPDRRRSGRHQESLQEFDPRSMGKEQYARRGGGGGGYAQPQAQSRTTYDSYDEPSPMYEPSRRRASQPSRRAPAGFSDRDDPFGGGLSRGGFGPSRGPFGGGEGLFGGFPRGFGPRMGGPGMGGPGMGGPRMGGSMMGGPRMGDDFDEMFERMKRDMFGGRGDRSGGGFPEW